MSPTFWLIIILLNSHVADGFLKIHLSKLNSSNANDSLSTTPQTLTVTPKSIKSDHKTTTISSLKRTTNTPTTTLITPAPIPKPNPSNVSNNHPDHKETKKPDHYFCICDLTETKCDLNCCCDIDCSIEIGKVFNCRHGHRSIRQEDLEYQYSLPSCGNNEGWLCVFKDNTAKTMAQTPNPNLFYMNNFSWVNPLKEPLPVGDSDSGHYKIDEPLQLFSVDMDTISTIDLPFPLLNHHCQFTESIRHLKSIQRYCPMSMEKSQIFAKELQEKFATSKLLKIPKNRNRIFLEKRTTTPNDCAKLNMFICQGTSKLLENCLEFKNNTFNNNDDLNDLTYYYWKIEIEFLHNFTDILESNIYFYTNTIETLQISSDDMWLQLVVNFIETKPSNFTEPTIASGPLGYNIGAPIIFSKLILLNETADEVDQQWTYDYFHPNRSQLKLNNHVLLAGSSLNGICLKNKDPINFAENTMNLCYMEYMNTTELTESTNYTRICDILQSEIFQILLNDQNITDNLEIYFSKLGHPQDIPENWIKMEIGNYEMMQVTGHLNKNTDSFTCSNMLIGGNFEFIVMQKPFGHVLQYQNVIENAHYEFDARVNLEFGLDEPIQIPIFVSVMFYDMVQNFGEKMMRVNFPIIFINNLVIFCWYKFAM